MSAEYIINKVLMSGILMRELMFIPDRGATEIEISDEESKLPRKLSEQHKNVLKHWNGINMDILRIYGCKNLYPELCRLSESQLDDLTEIDNCIVFGDDPSGFIYAEDFEGAIYSILTSTGDIKKLAIDLDDFLSERGRSGFTLISCSSYSRKNRNVIDGGK